LKAALELLANHLHDEPRWRLVARLDGSECQTLHLQLAPEFHLFHIEQHCSPGDICGALKRKVLEPTDKVMAVCISRDSYIPKQGLIADPDDEQRNGEISRMLSTFEDIPDRFYLVPISE
jgi:hypothetical protein